MGQAQGVADLVHRDRQELRSRNRPTSLVSSCQGDQREVNGALPGPLDVGLAHPFPLKLITATYHDLSASRVCRQGKMEAKPRPLPGRHRLAHDGREAGVVPGGIPWWDSEHKRRSGMVGPSAHHGIGLGEQGIEIRQSSRAPQATASFEPGE
jgi:hypothetical protein